MYKKLVALTLALALVLSMGTVAFAEWGSDSAPGTMTWTIAAQSVSIEVTVHALWAAPVARGGTTGAENIIVRNNGDVQVTLTSVTVASEWDPDITPEAAQVGNNKVYPYVIHVGSVQYAGITLQIEHTNIGKDTAIAPTTTQNIGTLVAVAGNLHPSVGGTFVATITFHATYLP